MAKTACYVDGFNLYHAIDALDVPRFKWLNLSALAKSFLRPGDELTSVVYFTSEMTWHAEKLRRHREYIKALKESDVEPVLAKFLSTSKYCKSFDRYCNFKEEKQTDVSFAIRVLTDCITNGMERAILITADSDQVPTLAAIRAMASHVEIFIACPPGRFKIARELKELSHGFREIDPGRLENCLFPRNVRNAKGVVVARCPAKYKHPEAGANSR